MRNKLTLIIAVLFMSMNMSHGQNPSKPDYEKIKTLKVAFFTERLSLTSAEAETFWPIYNEYEKSRYRLGKTEHHEFYSKLGNKNVSEREASRLLDVYLKIEEQEEELDKAFTLRIKKLLSAKKTLLLIRAEHNFKKQLIRQYRKKNGGGHP